MDEDLEDNLTRPSTWIRGLYMLLFAVILRLCEMVSFAVAGLQFLANLFSGQPNKRLQGFGGDLSGYVQKIVGFLTYASDAKPFPFSDWPGTKSTKGAKGPKNGSSAAPGRKKTPQPSTAKKTAGKKSGKS